MWLQYVLFLDMSGDTGPVAFQFNTGKSGWYSKRTQTQIQASVFQMAIREPTNEWGNGLETSLVVQVVAQAPESVRIGQENPDNLQAVRSVCFIAPVLYLTRYWNYKKIAVTCKLLGPI